MNSFQDNSAERLMAAKRPLRRRVVGAVGRVLSTHGALIPYAVQNTSANLAERECSLSLPAGVQPPRFITNRLLACNADLGPAEYILHLSGEGDTSCKSVNFTGYVAVGRHQFAKLPGVLGFPPEEGYQDWTVGYYLSNSRGWPVTREAYGAETYLPEGEDRVDIDLPNISDRFPYSFAVSEALELLHLLNHPAFRAAR